MEVETVLNLFDSYWYDLDLFNRSKPTKINKIPEIPTSSNSPILPTIQTKIINSNSNSKFNEFSSASPNSVLQSPKLHTIFSGKDLNQFDSNSVIISPTPLLKGSNSGIPDIMNMKTKTMTKKKKKGLSKSLSDLEFEELKGFMDLGFVFSEEDKDSTLASIIPGLHRLNNNNNINVNNNIFNDVIINNNGDGSKNGLQKIGGQSRNDGDNVRRPYLSEAWEEEVIEKRKKKNNKDNYSRLNWELIPNYSTNQIDMKDYLKSWAHNVASTVKL